MTEEQEMEIRRKKFLSEYPNHDLHAILKELTEEKERREAIEGYIEAADVPITSLAKGARKRFTPDRMMQKINKDRKAKLAFVEMMRGAEFRKRIGMLKNKDRLLKYERLVKLYGGKKAVEVMGLSRERLRQLQNLVGYRVDVNALKPKKKKIPHPCFHCQKDIWQTEEETKKHRTKFCSKDCYRAHYGQTYEQRKQRIKDRNRVRAKEYYWNVLKKRPDFKEFTRKNNLLYAEHVKEKKREKEKEAVRSLSEFFKEELNETTD